MNLAWTTWKPLNYQCIFYFGSAWKRWSNQLCRCQGCCTRIDQDYCEGMGPLWCSSQHRCIRLNPYPVRISPTFFLFLINGYIYRYIPSSVWQHPKKLALPSKLTAKKSLLVSQARNAPSLHKHQKNILSYLWDAVVLQKMLLHLFFCTSPTLWFKRNATDFNICRQLGLTSCFLCLWSYSGSYRWCWYLRKREQCINLMFVLHFVTPVDETELILAILI